MERLTALEDIFYMGTLNGSKLEKNFINTLELKLWPFEVLPYYVCTGKPFICSVFRPRAT